MSFEKWRWQGGRLVKYDGETSLSVSQAYHLIPFNRGIELACKKVIRPYKKQHDDFLKARLN